MKPAIESPVDKPLLEVKDLCKSYFRRRWMRGPSLPFKAVDSVSFSLRAGTSIAFVGESGSGKSTLAMCICRLVEPEAGQLLLGGIDLLQLSGRLLRDSRRRVHLVFQDPLTAFNPSFTAEQIITEPMVLQGTSISSREEAALRLIERVGLPPDSLHRSPMQFSGGQRQRLAIARALAADAELIIFDESLSGLDMSVQADIADLLLSVQQERNLAYIFVSHDIELAAFLADEIAVMNAGRIVELNTSSSILESAVHPHSQALVNAMLQFEGQP
jgi:peptide/nickel transport system ATP-binding protein